MLAVLLSGAAAQYPESWGSPPMMGTMDYRPLPGGYGHGSSTLANWIEEKMKEDEKANNRQFPPAWGSPPRMQTRDLRRFPFNYGMGSGTVARWILAYCNGEVRPNAKMSSR